LRLAAQTPILRIANERGKTDLLSGHMIKPSDPFYNPDDFVPSLREAFERQPLDLDLVIRAAVPVKDLEKHRNLMPAGLDRGTIYLTTGDQFCLWEIDSLRALFRGDAKPPVLGDYPEAYQESFMTLDLHALQLSKFFGDRRDLEMLEVYSALRRRPDGRSLGFVHDYMWQAAAIVLGTRPLSQAEFEAILSRLERSCRTFEMGPTSRNYIATLRRTLGQEE
jgi:hypothetical protein